MRHPSLAKEETRRFHCQVGQGGAFPKGPLFLVAEQSRGSQEGKGCGAGWRSQGWVGGDRETFTGTRSRSRRSGGPSAFPGVVGATPDPQALRRPTCVAGSVAVPGRACGARGGSPVDALAAASAGCSRTSGSPVGPTVFPLFHLPSRIVASLTIRHPVSR